MAINQLSAFHFLRSPETVMDELVEYLESNLVDDDGFLILELVP